MKKIFWAVASLVFLLPVGAYAADSLLVDNLDAGYAELSGTWFGSSYGYLDSSRWCLQDTTPNATARFSATTLSADTYNIYYIVPSSENSSTSGLYRIHHAAGDDSVWKDQNISSGSWVYLGAYDLPGDGSGFVEAINDTAGATGYAFRADAMLWEAVGDTQDIHLVHFYHDFGIVDIGDSSEWSFDFSNVGGDSLVVDSIKTSTPEFTIVAPAAFPLKVAPGATEWVTTKFLPASGGDYADSVQIFSNDPDTAEWVRQVQVVGKSGVLLVDDGDAGYSEPVGTNWVSGGGFQGDHRWTTVNTDIGATAQYVFDVPSAATYNAFYFFGVVGSSNSATAAKFKIIHATGADSVYRNQNLRSGEYWQFLGQHQFNSGPDLYVIDYSLDFGEVTVGQYADLSFMAHNIGDATVTINSLVFSNADFSAVSYPATIAAGVTDTITLRFSPTAQVPYTGETVTIFNDDPDFNPSVFLEGVGTGNIVIVDNEDGAPGYTEQGTWGTSSSSAYGANSRYHTTPLAPDTVVWAQYLADIPVADYYDVYWVIVNTDWTDANALYTVSSGATSLDTQRVNQQFTANQWQYLGTYYFPAGTGTGQVRIHGDNLCTGPVVRADAVKWLQTAWADTIPPGIVTDLVAEKSASDINLSWTPADDIYTGIDYYIIFRNTTPGFTPTSGDSIGEASGPSFLDPGAAGTVGTNYYYAVQAVDKAGNKGNYSTQVGEFDRSTVNAK